jgi:hypothetical protein
MIVLAAPVRLPTLGHRAGWASPIGDRQGERHRAEQRPHPVEVVDVERVEREVNGLDLLIEVGACQGDAADIYGSADVGGGHDRIGMQQARSRCLSTDAAQGRDRSRKS